MTPSILASTPAGRQIFTLEANANVYAILTASAVQAYQIQPGNVVTIARSGIPNGRFRGTVVAVLDAATPGSTNFTVKVAVPNQANSLRAGTPVQATIALLLVGLVTKKGILLVDYANTVRRHDGTNKHDAVIESGATRFRPIIMTTMAMIAGMLPLALALEPGSQSRASLGAVVIGGLFELAPPNAVRRADHASLARSRAIIRAAQNRAR